MLYSTESRPQCHNTRSQILMLADLRSFFRHALLPIFFLLFGLLVVSNVVLLSTRSSPGNQGATGVKTSAGNAYPPLAFGAVQRRLQPAPKFHQFAVPGVYTYSVTKDAMPALPPTMDLYRDQGMVLDNDVFQRLLESAGVQGADRLQMLPSTVGFETPDGARTLSLDIMKREFVVRMTSDSDQAIPRQADQQVMDVADAFAAEQGMTMSSYGTPVLVRGSGSVAASRLPSGFAEVRWPLKVAAWPVLDQYGKPVTGMSVVVNLKTGKATRLTVRLLSPSVLAASSYPVASPDMLLAAVNAGGLTPIRVTPGKPAVSVPLRDLTVAYVLWEGDERQPAYLIPSVMFSADVALACKDCAPWRWTSYTPVLDPAQFSWAVQASSSASVAN